METPKACIFDIKRFATRDGKGIRTTVFFKGCPLHCVWCQNPEGMDFSSHPMYMEKKCIGCGTCAALSRHGGCVRRKDGKIRMDHEAPEEWETIEKACPSGAIVMDSHWVDLDTLLEEVKKDEVFFRHGGGVTLSGGEPLAQYRFVASFLKMLLYSGIHTAIETALGVPDAAAQTVLPLVDQIYCDMKVADEERHRQYVGVSGYQIRRNLEWLLTSDYRTRVTVRTPLIPGYTATEENLSGIARFLSSLYPDVTYELLNYNTLAPAKYKFVGKTYCFDDAHNPGVYTKDEMEHFGDVVRANGIRNLIMDL